MSPTMSPIMSPTHDVLMVLQIDYSNVLNNTEIVTEQDRIKVAVAGHFNMNISVVSVRLSRFTGVRKMLAGIKYDAEIQFSGLSTLVKDEIVGVKISSFEKEIRLRLGLNVTVTQNPESVTSSPTSPPTPAPTDPVSKAMTKTVFMYWNIMIALLAFY